MPSLAGQVWVVTGANSGLGLETTRALAAKGATVVMGCRDPQRAQAGEGDVRRTVPTAKLERRSLDLASLASIDAFAKELLAAHPTLDGLVNNAGVMALPYRKTADGFEMQLGTNHLGHYALTLKLLTSLERAAAPRVVNVSSMMHRRGVMNFDDLMGEKSYSPWGAYSQSKLANLLFGLELSQRLKTAGKKTLVAAAHPGYAATGLQVSSAKMHESKLNEFIMNLGNNLLAQSSAMGALPSLYAATASDVKPNDFIGPSGFMRMRGFPSLDQPIARAKDTAAAAELWKRSEALTGVSFTA